MSIGGMPSTHDRDDRTLNDPSAPLLPSSDEAPTTRMAPPADNSTLLADILKLTLPLSATTVVEFLPQILIAAMVGHADPHSALPGGSEESTEGAVLTAFGLANLVYSTCAFSLVYGFICGLDSVAASSYGMTLRDCATGEEKEVSGASEFSVAVPPAHGNNLPSRTIAWGSPALRGLYVTPRHSRCSSAHSQESRSVVGTPGRSQLSSSVPTAVLRRSPSVPCGISRTPRTLAPTSHLGSLEEHSMFGAWKRRHDEGIDAPDTPEDEELHLVDVDRLQAPTTRSYAHLSVVTPHHISLSASSTPQGWSSYMYPHTIQTSTLDVPSPFVSGTPEMAALDLTNSITPAVSPAPSPVPSPNMVEGAKQTHEYDWADAAVARAKSPPTEASGDEALSASPTGELPSSLIGVWVKRCLMLEMYVVAALIVLLYFGCAPFLRALGEPADAIDVATEYVLASCFGLPFVAVYHACNKGLQSSGVVTPVLIISLVAKCASCACVYIGLYHLQMPLVGVAWILAFSIAAQASSVYAYMAWSGIVDQWWGTRIDGDKAASQWCWSDYWHGLCEYSILAFPACAAILLEFALFDLIGALAGLLPNPAVELSVHYLLFTSTLASYMIFSGLSVSVSVLVGQKLGVAGESRNAKQSAIIGTLCCLCMSGMLILVLIFFHQEVARCLTSQPLLLSRFAECVPVLIAYQFVDGLNTCSTQLLRTLGVQKYGVILHFSTYYALGMTTGYLLAFPLGLGVKGLWAGLCVGVGLNAILATVWLWFYADWAAQEQAAIERTACMQESQNGKRISPSYASTEDSGRSSAAAQTTIAAIRAENAAQHGV